MNLNYDVTDTTAIEIAYGVPAKVGQMVQYRVFLVINCEIIMLINLLTFTDV